MDAENHQQDNPHRPGKKPLFTWHGACLLVLLAIMLLLFAMPNINRIPGKAKEAEVKQNCHAIQLALEKYAVDHQGTYPLIAMGGDWTDSYTVWQEWVDSIPDLNPDMIENGARREAWMPAEPDVGDLLIMEGYLPSYPTNPFAKTSTKRLLRRIHHYPCPSPCPGTPPFWRIVG
ncbi:hypothetical protein JW859_06135, partial [bacterium]|nr:hypothetical protein [bacterium]